MPGGVAGRGRPKPWAASAMRRAAAAVREVGAAGTRALCLMPRPDAVRGGGEAGWAQRNNMSPVPAPQRLAIAQVTPFAWEVANEVNEYVARVSGELASRGHRVLIVAPSEDAALVRDSRRALRSRPEQLLDDAQGKPTVLGVGEVLPFAPARRRAASLPVDVARTIEEALTALPLDIVNVHEPFAPSASSAALRHSRALNVGSFHAPTERVLSTQLTGPLSRLLFSRMDARTASYAATRNLLQHYFPGEYTVVAPGADVAPDRAPAEIPEIVMIATEERAALRLFLRALRALPPEPLWHATVWYPRPTAPPATLTRLLRERITFKEASEGDEADLLRTADIAVFASEGDRATPGTLVRALGAGAVPVASRLPAYEEALGEGECGFMFEPGETATLAAHLTRLVAEPELRDARRPRVRAAAPVAGLGARGLRARGHLSRSRRPAPGGHGQRRRPRPDRRRGR